MKDKYSPFFPLTIAFTLLAVLVGAQGTKFLDLGITVFLQRIHVEVLDYFFFFLLIPASIECSFLILLIVSWWLYRKYEWSGAVYYPVIFISLGVVEFVLKQVISYPGPGPEFDRSPFTWGFVSVQTPYAFPSGHTFRGVFLLGIWHQWLKRLGSLGSASVKMQKLFIAVWLCGIGVGLVYLGSHWFSDVVGGYLLAAIGLCLISEPVHPELRPA